MLAVNDIVFLHAHELPNGEIIIHAHPYNKDADSAPLKKHHHSTEEYIAIQNIQLLFPFSFFILPAVLFYRKINRTVVVQIIIEQICIHRIPGRSPPL
jgi:hypothetical protein